MTAADAARRPLPALPRLRPARAAGASARSPRSSCARRWLLLAGLGAQILVISVFPDGAGALHTGAHLASYACIAAFVAANWARVPFLWLIALGGALNLAAIAANGGVMPADPDALAAAGIATPAGEFSNSTAVADAKLQFLGDVL